MQNHVALLARAFQEFIIGRLSGRISSSLLALIGAALATGADRHARALAALAGSLMFADEAPWSELRAVATSARWPRPTFGSAHCGKTA